ncbi:MAG TPA: DUF2892 domain-containing protein [Firmicutes bacterium]|nr:DUF2892 domain-containing protein [Bacillota bacterium]
MVKKNLGMIDRALRIGGGLALVGLGIKRNRGVIGYLFPLMGGALLVEGLSSYSFMYNLMGFSTGDPRR